MRLYALIRRFNVNNSILKLICNPNQTPQRNYCTNLTAYSEASKTILYRSKNEGLTLPDSRLSITVRQSGNAIGQKNRSMEHNRNPKNKPIYMVQLMYNEGSSVI
jgi:hypothetical protein